MASFYEDFSGNLSNWIASSAAPIDRAWWTDSGLLKVQDSVSGKFGLIRYKDPIDTNGTIIVEYNGLDLYNGTDNLIVFRYTDDTHFNFINIEPGQNDDRGIGIGFNELTQEPFVRFDMYNSDGDPLSGETAPNKTIIPVTGKVTLEFTNNVYAVEIRDSVNAFIASGTYIDTANNNVNAGYVGFGHDDKWDSNINGWDSINVNDANPVVLPPIIQSFSATDYTINLGDSTTLGWVVTSGSASTSVELDGVNVSLIGTSGITPSTSGTYSLSAWNTGGSDYSEFDIFINDTFPTIIDFSNTGPLSAGDTTLLNWEISGGTSAFIDNGIGWLTPYTSAGSSATPQLYNSTTYSITAYDDDFDTTTASTTVTVSALPTVDLVLSDTPVCSGTPFQLIWNTTNAVSAYIDNGIGQVAVNDTLTVSANVPTNYTISAINDIGMVTDSVNAIVYYRSPIAYVGDDVYAASPAGDPVSIGLNGSQSYDPDGLSLSYEWYEGATLLSTDESFISDYTVGTHVVDLTVTDNCGQSGTDSLNVVVQSQIPPVAVAEANTNILAQPGQVTLDGSNSYDDEFIVGYSWKANGVVIGSSVVLNYDIPTYGAHVFELTVTDNLGLTGSDTVTVVVTEEASPTANAGDDQTLCMISATTVTLDGSNSLNSPVSDIVWFEWNLSEFGLPSVASSATSLNEISATFEATTSGSYSSILTVSADNGYSDQDAVEINIFNRPEASAEDYTEILDFGQVLTNVTLSAYTNVVSASYVWEYGSSVYYEQFPTLELSKGTYYPTVQVTDLESGCVSQLDTATITISGDTDLKIIDFSLDPFQSITLAGATSATTVLSWDVQGATSVYIDYGLGSVNPVSGAETLYIPYPGGVIPFSITATDGVNTITETTIGNYVFIYEPVDPIQPGGGFSPLVPVSIEVCKLREDIVKTYGVDELKFGRDRYINLINYLPDYIKNSDTGIIVQEFENYLNHMYVAQRNYTWDENVLDVRIGNDKTTKQWSSCDDVTGCAGDCAVRVDDKGNPSTDCTNDVSPAVMNEYLFESLTSAGPETMEIVTPASSVGEVFISDICGIKDDKISILDKINRITDLFDPDLIPIDLIQFYAENLGYQAGINREALGASRTDPLAKEIEQKRYLRFMVRNLPNWYKIKTNRASIRIMMYSFGLIGDFVYYYTKCYSDRNDPKSKGLCGNSIDGNGANGSANGSTNGIDCDISLFNTDPSNITALQISKNRCCLKESQVDSNEFLEKTNTANGITNNDWILTDTNTSNLLEDLSTIPEDKGYFSSPHFKLQVNILESTGNFSTDKERQRMIKTAVNAIKPINTVFDGVVAYFEMDNIMMYYGAKSRVRTHITIKSDGTYLS